MARDPRSSDEFDFSMLDDDEEPSTIREPMHIIEGRLERGPKSDVPTVPGKSIESIIEDEEAAAMIDAAWPSEPDLAARPLVTEAQEVSDLQEVSEFEEAREPEETSEPEDFLSFAEARTLPPPMQSQKTMPPPVPRTFPMLSELRTSPPPVPRTFPPSGEGRSSAPPPVARTFPPPGEARKSVTPPAVRTFPPPRDARDPAEARSSTPPAALRPSTPPPVFPATEGRKSSMPPPIVVGKDPETPAPAASMQGRRSSMPPPGGFGGPGPAMLVGDGNASSDAPTGTAAPRGPRLSLEEDQRPQRGRAEPDRSRMTMWLVATCSVVAVGTLVTLLLRERVESRPLPTDPPLLPAQAAALPEATADEVPRGAEPPEAQPSAPTVSPVPTSETAEAPNVVTRVEQLLRSDRSKSAATEARSLLEPELAQLANDPHAHAALAEACLRLHDGDCATRAVERAIALRPRREQYRALKAKIDETFSPGEAAKSEEGTDTEDTKTEDTKTEDTTNAEPTAPSDYVPAGETTE